MLSRSVCVAVGVDMSCCLSCPYCACELSEALLCHVLHFLPFDCLSAISAVNSHWAAISSNGWLWRQWYISQYPDELSPLAHHTDCPTCMLAPRAVS